MFIISQSYEKAKMIDIERNVATQQHILEYVVDDLLFDKSARNIRPKRKIWMAFTGVIAIITNLMYH